MWSTIIERLNEVKALGIERKRNHILYSMKGMSDKEK